MKNFKYFLALCFTIIIFASCDSDVTVEDSKAETEDVITKTGSEDNEEVDREEGQ